MLGVSSSWKQQRPLWLWLSYCRKPTVAAIISAPSTPSFSLAFHIFSLSISIFAQLRFVWATITIVAQILTVELIVVRWPFMHRLYCLYLRTCPLNCLIIFIHTKWELTR